MEEEGGAIWKKEEERMMTEWMRELDVTECIGVETVDAYDLYKRELAPRRGETKWEAMYASPFAQDVYERFIGGWCAEWVLPKIDVWISEGELARVRMRNERAVRAYVRVGEMYENGFVDDTDSEVEIRAFDKVEKIVRGRCGRKVVLFGLQVRYEDDGADWTTDGDEKVSGDKKRLLRHVWRVYVYATAVN